MNRPLLLATLASFASLAACDKESAPKAKPAPEPRAPALDAGTAAAPTTRLTSTAATTATPTDAAP